jgi:hypothetical protein
MQSFPWKLAACSLVLTGCTSMCGKSRASLSPEQVVEAYLDVALNMNDVSERDLLLDYTTGNLKAAIEAASPEVIKAAYVDRQYKIEKYSVVERRDRTPRETEITFELSYVDMGTNKKATSETAPTVTTANTVSVVKESGVWLMRDVLGNKTTIDFPVSEESRISAKPGPGIDEEPQEPAPEQPAPEGDATKGG